MTDTSLLWLELAQWLPLRAPLTRNPGHRTPEDYVAVCEQFKVTHAWRYRATPAKTHCNIYVWDCTTALDCEIPHWFDPETGKRCDVSFGSEMTANLMCDWLAEGHCGWGVYQAEDAFEQAGKGFPTVAVWRNKSGSGHCAMVLPRWRVAAAGRTNVWQGALQETFGNHKPLFYSHD